MTLTGDRVSCNVEGSRNPYYCFQPKPEGVLRRCFCHEILPKRGGDLRPFLPMLCVLALVLSLIVGAITQTQKNFLLGESWCNKDGDVLLLRGSNSSRVRIANEEKKSPVDSNYSQNVEAHKNGRRLSLMVYQCDGKRVYSKPGRNFKRLQVRR